MEVDCLPISSIMAEEWTVDDVRVTTPIGMRGTILKGKVHFAQLPKFIENNLLACIESQGVHIEEFVFMPLAAGVGCLTCEDIQLGAAVIDLGALSTGIAVYLNGGIAASTALNLGCGFIVNDIAAGLKVSFDEAAELLIEYGISDHRIRTLNKRNGDEKTSSANKDTPIKLQRTGIGAPTTVSRDELDTIIFARSAEIADKAVAQLKNNKLLDRLSRGIVLTGGGAAINNQDALFETKSDLTVRIGVPEGFEELPEFLDLPEWTPVMGIVKYAAVHRQAMRSGHALTRYGDGNSFLARINRFRSKYFI
jgi:cell division protein FtsA